MEKLYIYRYPKHKSATCKDLFLIDEALFLTLPEEEMTIAEKQYKIKDEEMVEDYLSDEEYSHIDQNCLEFFKKHYLVRSFMDREFSVPAHAMDTFQEDSERLNVHSVAEKLVSFYMEDGIAQYITDILELESGDSEEIPKELLEDILMKCEDIVAQKELPKNVFPLWEGYNTDYCDYEYAVKALSNTLNDTDFSVYSIGCVWF